jgi:hypothetical protein
MFEQHLAAWLEQVSVDDRQHGHIVVQTALRGYDGVVVIDDLLQVGDGHGHTTDLFDRGTFLLLLLALWLQTLLVLDELLLEQNVIFDSLLPQQAQSTFRIRSDLGQLVLRIEAGSLLLLTASSLRTSFSLTLLFFLTALALLLGLLGVLAGEATAGTALAW